MGERVFNIWIHFRREGVEWSAHCLDFDVVTQGRSIEHAFEMIDEAVTLVLDSDLKAGLDPYDRRAPDEEWGQMYAVVRGGQQIAASELSESVDAFVVNMELRVRSGDVPRPELVWKPSRRLSDACAIS